MTTLASAAKRVAGVISQLGDLPDPAALTEPALLAILGDTATALERARELERIILDYRSDLYVSGARNRKPRIPQIRIAEAARVEPGSVRVAINKATGTR